MGSGRTQASMQGKTPMPWARMCHRRRMFIPQMKLREVEHIVEQEHANSLRLEQEKMLSWMHRKSRSAKVELHFKVK